MIHFACPSCKKEYDVPEDVAGKKTKCRACGQGLRVPVAVNTTAPLAIPVVSPLPPLAIPVVSPLPPLAIPVVSPPPPPPPSTLARQSPAVRSLVEEEGTPIPITFRPSLAFVVILFVIGAGAVLVCLSAVLPEDRLGPQAAERNATRKETLPPGDMTLKQYVIQKPDGPTAVQVECEAATYYNYAYRGCAATHYSFMISSGRPDYKHAYVYAAKESEEGQRLFALLKDGSKRAMTLRVQRVGPLKQPLPAEHEQCFALVGIVDGRK
jgi:hypothetical protein